LMFGISFVLVFELPFPPNEMSITIALKHFWLNLIVSYRILSVEFWKSIDL
jgi:hypothetical protein